MVPSLAVLQMYIDNRLVSRKKHPDQDLFIYDYTETAQYSGELKRDPVLRTIRGLILDSRGEVVARGFNKFFNWGEFPEQDAFYAGKLPTSVFEKVDGSLGIAYSPTQMATRGSFISEQALRGTAMMAEYREWFESFFQLFPDITPCFEIVYPENRIVVNYNGMQELVLLGFVDKETGLRVKTSPDRLGWRGWYASSHDIRSPEDLKKIDAPNREGFVLVYDDGHMVKVKFDNYLKLHKVVSGITDKWIIEQLEAGTLDKALEICPDELVASTKARAAEFVDRFVFYAQDIIARFYNAEGHLKQDKKTFALKVKGDRLAAALFRLWDVFPKHVEVPMIFRYVREDLEAGVFNQPLPSVKDEWKGVRGAS
jgi:RNA ligase